MDIWKYNTEPKKFVKYLQKKFVCPHNNRNLKYMVGTSSRLQVTDRQPSSQSSIIMSS